MEDKRKKTVSLVIFLFTISVAETLVGTVSYVSDGDTLHLQTTRGKYKIRFYGIDPPDSTQEYGLEAKSFVTDKVLRKEVKVKVMDIDRYGRKIGKVYYGNGRYLNEEVLGQDMLVVLEYAILKELRKLLEPIEDDCGIKLTMAPWDYRRAKNSSSSKSINMPKNPDAIVCVTKSGEKYH